MEPRQSGNSSNEYIEMMPNSHNSHMGPGNSYNDASEDRPSTVFSGHRRFNTIYTGPTSNFESHANKIVEKLEQHKELMEDTPISQQLRKEALRELPQCITIKRCVKMKLSRSVSKKSKPKPISLWKRFKFHMSMTFRKFTDACGSFNYFQLWHGTLKTIESNFGSGYASYFKFLRWLFVMNLFVALLSFSLLAIPQILYDSSGESTFNFQGFQVRDIFTGVGFFSETVLYYGHYTNNTISLIPYLNYNMPAAYFSVNVILYLLSIITVGVSAAQSYRRTFIETEGGLHNAFANKVFCGWDYAIATKEAAKLKSASIYHELKELLSESYKDEEEHSCFYKFWTFTIQITVNILIVVILIGVVWATWLMLDKFSSQEDGGVLVTTVAVNLILMIFPVIFNYCSKHEDYSNPRVALYITLIRNYLLGFVIIGTILAYWLKKNETECWETHLGAEIYRLIVFDFIINVILSTFLEILCSLIAKCWGKHPASEFNISKHTLEIIYNHALFWVGFFYSPVLPVIITLKMLVIWYIREASVRSFCEPPKRSWRAAQTQTVFMMLTFVSLVAIVAVQGYTLKSIPPSDCGPFKDHQYIYEILTENVDSIEKDHLVWHIILYVTKPGAVALIMMALCVLVYYFKEQALAEKSRIETLRNILIWMGKDKQYLSQLYANVNKGEMVKSFRSSRYMDPGDNSSRNHDYRDDDYSSNRSSLVADDMINARFKKYH